MTTKKLGDGVSHHVDFVNMRFTINMSQLNHQYLEILTVLKHCVHLFKSLFDGYNQLLG